MTYNMRKQLNQGVMHVCQHIATCIMHQLVTEQINLIIGAIVYYRTSGVYQNRNS